MRRNFDIEYDVISDGNMPNVDLDWLDSEITDIFSPVRNKINLIYVSPGSIFVGCNTSIEINLDFSCYCEDINETVLYNIYEVINRLNEFEAILSPYSEYIKNSTIYIGAYSTVYVYFKPVFKYSYLHLNEYSQGVLKSNNINTILDSLLNTLNIELPLFIHNEVI